MPAPLRHRCSPAISAARQAVLFRLSAAGSLRGLYRLMLDRWRARLTVMLRVPGVSLFAGDSKAVRKRHNFAAVCPPFGCPSSAVGIPKGCYACGMSRFCPHCYGRDIMDTYAAYERVIFGGADPAGYALLYRLVTRLPPVTPANSGAAALTDAVDAAFAAASAHATRLVRRAARERLNGRVDFIVLPGPRPVAVVRALLVAGPEWDPGVMRAACRRHGRVRGTCVEIPSRTALARVVAAAFPYPVGLLYKDAATTARIVRRRRMSDRIRAVRCFGAVKSALQQERSMAGNPFLTPDPDESPAEKAVTLCDKIITLVAAVPPENFNKRASFLNDVHARVSEMRARIAGDDRVTARQVRALKSWHDAVEREATPVRVKPAKPARSRPPADDEEAPDPEG